MCHDDDDDQLRPARGFANAIAIMVVVCCIALLAWRVAHAGVV